jgi:hypothetical protein
MLQAKFLATIRNANDVFMKFIGSPTTCPVPWDISVFDSINIMTQNIGHHAGRMGDPDPLTFLQDQFCKSSKTEENLLEGVTS